MYHSLFIIFCNLLDSLQVAVDVFEVVVEIFEVFVDGCGWFYVVLGRPMF